MRLVNFVLWGFSENLMGGSRKLKQNLIQNRRYFGILKSSILK